MQLINAMQYIRCNKICYVKLCFHIFVFIYYYISTEHYYKEGNEGNNYD